MGKELTLNITASRGRGEKNSQHYEYRKDKVFNTITSVQKDNYYIAKVCRNKTSNKGRIH